MKMNNFIAAMIAMLLGGPLAWEFFDRTAPLAVIEGVTIPAQIQRGGSYHIDWTINPMPGTHCPGTVYRYLRDSAGTIWAIPPSPASFGLMPMQFGRTRVEGTPHTVPKLAALGKAEIYIRASYVCNFTQYLWPLTIIVEPVKTEIID